MFWLYNFALFSRSLIVGKFCRSLYPYEAQNHDELSFDAGQIMTIVSVEDQDWIAVRNEKSLIKK